MGDLSDFGFIQECERIVKYKKTLSVNNIEGRNDRFLAVITPEIVDGIIPLIGKDEYYHSILITLNPQMFKYSDDWIIDMLKTFIKTKRKAKFYIIPDYSEEGRLHFHGLMKVENTTYKYISKVRNDLEKAFGRTWIRPIRNIPQYIKYMFKIYIDGKIRFDIDDQVGGDYLQKFISQTNI